MQNLNSLLAHDFGLIGPPALNGDSGACHCQKVITLLCRWPPGPEGLRVRRLVSQSREVFVCLRPLVGFLSGAGDSSFPPWLKSLMTICCCVTDCYLQNVAISTLLEVFFLNYSGSLRHSLQMSFFPRANPPPLPPALCILCADSSLPNWYTSLCSALVLSISSIPVPAFRQCRVGAEDGLNLGDILNYDTRRRQIER